MDIKERVLLVISKTLKTDKSKIRNPNKLKWDSLQLISIVSNLELEFDVVFEPEEISEMANVDKINMLLLPKLKQQG